MLNWLSLQLLNKFSLRTVLLVPFVLQLLVVISFVGYFTVCSNRHVMSDMAVSILRQTSMGIEEKLNTYLDTIHQMNQHHLNLIQLGLLNPFALKTWQPYLWEEIQHHKSIDFTGLGNNVGEYISMGQLEQDKAILSLKDAGTGHDLRRYAISEKDSQGQLVNVSKNFDVRLRPWYLAAEKAGQATWSEVYRRTDDQRLVMTATLPVYDAQKKLQAVLNSTVSLSRISEFLQNSNISSMGTVFIVERSGLLIASSSSQPMFTLTQNSQTMLRLHAVQSQEPLIHASATKLLEHFTDFSKINSAHQLSFKLDTRELSYSLQDDKCRPGEQQFVQISPFKDSHGIDWLIVVVLPENRLADHVNSFNQINILVLVSTFLVAILVWVLILKGITGPISRLNRATQQIATGQWLQEIPVGYIKEFISLAESFNMMTAQLKSSFAAIESDIEKRTHIEAALRHSEQCLKEALNWQEVIFNNSSVGILVVTGNRMITEINSKLLVLLGYERNELIAHSVAILHRSYDAYLEFGELAYSKTAYKDINSFEYQLKRKDGSLLWCELSGRAVNRGDLGKGVVWVISDITERKQAAETIKRANERFMTVLNELQVGIYVADMDTYEILFANKYIQDMFNIDQLSGKRCWEVLQKDISGPCPFCNNDKLLTPEGKPDKAGYQWEFLNSMTNRWFYLQDRAIVWTDGHLVRLEIATDITERRQIEEALKESEERLLEAQQIAHLGHWEWNLITGKQQWSEELLRIFGVSPEKDTFGHESFERLIHREDIELVMTTLETAIERDEPYRIEFRIVCPNETIRHIQVFGKLIRDDNRRPLRFIGTAQDITERKYSENTLRQSERRFRTIFEKIPIGMCIMNTQGLFTAVNPAFCHLFNYSQEELLGQHFTLLIPEDRILYFLQLHEYSLNNVQEVHGEWQLKAKGDTTLTALVDSIWIISIQGQLERLISVVDVSGLNQAREELEKAKDIAETANRAKSAFLANMSHELRTPLNAILGYTQILLRDKALNKLQQEGIQVIHRGGEYLLTLISDILDISKIESERMELQPSDFHLNQFIQDIVDLFRLRAEQKNISFNYKPLTPLPHIVHADEKRLRQILINLLSNAIKFTKEGGVILSIKWDSGKTWIWVEDSGIGIAPEEVEHIFLPFYQLANSNYLTEGTGLGLSITKKLIDMMGGEILVSSRLGQGTTFEVRIQLPKVEGETDSTEKQQAVIVGYRRSLTQNNGDFYAVDDKYTILIVDDVRENQMILKHFLESLEFNCPCANDGCEGVRLARQLKPDLILMDLVMPGLDGFEATRQIKKIPELSSIPIVAVSASAFDLHKKQSIEAGCDDFIPKPVRTEILLAYLQKHLKLEWIYETILLSTDSQEEEVYTSTSELLVDISLTTEQAEDLYELASIGDIQGILDYSAELAQSIPALSPILHKIQKFAENLQDRKIREFLEPYRRPSL